jgi:signal transduction histidine kinase
LSEIRDVIMIGNESPVLLKDIRDVLVRDVQKEAQLQLWHLNRNLWSRKGLMSQCLAESIDCLAGILQSDAEAETSSGGSDGLPEEELVYASMKNWLPGWCDAPLTWQDIHTLLELLRKQIRAAYKTRDTEYPGYMIEGALMYLAAFVAEHKMAKAEEEGSLQRHEFVASQHLAGRFLANASHELRTPLTAVLGFSELLLEETYGELTEGQRIAVGHIENSAQNLLEIVNNLLDLLHIRAGKLQLQFRPVAMVPLLKNVYDILMPLSQRRSVSFLQFLPDDLGSIEADESIVRHIVYYLLASTLRATPKGGEVILKAERRDGGVRILTQDTAMHLPPEALDNMRDAFPILENSPARGYDGWEIGLPLVKRYVDLHGGVLDMESLPETGTIFTVRLPTHQPTKKSEARQVY